MMPARSATSNFPAEIYREHVLTHVFADAQRMFLPALLDVHRAHLVMLTKQGIVSKETATACARALNALDVPALSTAVYDGSTEDLFFLVERELARLAGDEHAGRLHTARSRNDIDLTMYRMVLRERLLDTLEATLILRATLLQIADTHRAALMPAYTHNQPAQPTTLGHYMMAMIEILERDAERIIQSYGRVNRSPLGACAITTTGFPVDRAHTEKLLGFRGLVTNSYGAIAAVDYVTEACGVLATAMVSLGRFVQDMLLWSTEEFNFLRLSDGYVQTSSIMPQKRNPVPLEHARILASRALAEAQSVLASLHNTPFADMNDAEDSLQPLVALAFADGQRALALLAGALSEATFNTEHMKKRAAGSFLTVTEVADTLVRLCGMSFHQAHSVVSSAVKAALSFDPIALAADLQKRANEIGATVSLEAIEKALDPENFVTMRAVRGGPAPFALAPELDRASRQLFEDEAWRADETSRLLSAKESLLHECTELANGSHPSRFLCDA